MTKFVDVPGGRIARDVTGSGPPVVLSHGIGDRRQAYRFLAPVLAQAGCRVANGDLTRPSSSDPEPEPERNFGQLVKQAHRSFPTGVTVVTACIDGAPVGLAVNAFTSVSMDPPMVLVCVNSGSRSHPALCTARYLGISILSREQSGVAVRFAISGGDKFSDIGWHHGEQGAPVLDRASASLEIEVTDRVVAGTHSVIFGRVVAVETSKRPPLVYSGGQFFDGGRLLKI
jgi:flavin reductase (DIM6/NTAB) family NADH-FMN oxidoreductase RutF